ncbi:MAG: F0F1 ATP synthase subunit epsilon [Desulfuromonadales bacterium]|nr:F0F1 ATP synthase subunit epsilon [Desulfuromonadales bacterium]
MKLSIYIPTRILLETDVTSITATGLNGSFGLRPHHIDFVSALVPGLLAYRRTETDEEGVEEYVAVDRGILVKQGDQVRVSVRNAVADAPLEELSDVVEHRFADLGEHERKVQTAVARLEADFLRRFIDM